MIKVLISKTLIDSYIKHEEFISVSNVWKKYTKLKEEIKNPKNFVEYTKNEKVLCQW